MKQNTSFRFSKRGTEILNELTEVYGLSQQGVGEMLVRRVERTGYRDYQRQTLTQSVKKAREASSPMGSRTMALSKEAIGMLDEICRRFDIAGRAEAIETSLFGAADAEGLL